MLAWSYLQRCTFRLNLLNLCRWQELQSTLTSLDLQINSNSPVPYFGFDVWGHRIGTGTLTQAGQFVFYSFLKPLDTFHIPETRPCWSETSPAERPGSSASLYREDMHIWGERAVLLLDTWVFLDLYRFDDALSKLLRPGLSLRPDLCSEWGCSGQGWAWPGSCCVPGRGLGAAAGARHSHHRPLRALRHLESRPPDSVHEPWSTIWIQDTVNSHRLSPRLSPLVRSSRGRGVLFSHLMLVRSVWIKSDISRLEMSVSRHIDLLWIY